VKIKNIFIKILFVFKKFFSIFEASKKRVKMKGSFLHNAAPPPAGGKYRLRTGTRIFCSLKTYLSWILHHQPLTSSFRSNYLQYFHYHTIKSAIQKLQLFLFSLY
jgi:hypothetical protein